MTFLKTALTTTAALAVAVPAFAGDKAKTADAAMMKSDTAVVTTTTVTEMETDMEVMGASETMMHPSKVNDTVGEVLQADGEPSIQADQEIIVDRGQMTDAEFRALDDDGMIADNAIAVPGSNGTVSTVTCPAGTEAQTNGTCLVTGNWIPTTDD